MDYEIEYDAARKMTVAAMQLCRDAEEYRDRGCYRAARAAARAANLLFRTANECDPNAAYIAAQDSRITTSLQVRIDRLMNVGFVTNP
jgi:hypothetical protein